MKQNKKAIIEKIMKCFALGKSSNEHEAAAAIEKAHKLMLEYNISETDILISDVSVSKSQMTTGQKPPLWVSCLISCVTKAFHCRAVYSIKFKDHTYQMYGNIDFVGVGVSPEIAKFTFDVLYRKLSEARKEFIKKHVAKTTSKKRKTERADLFCLAWVDAIKEKVSTFANYKENPAITKYMGINYPTVETLKPIDRISKRTFNDRDMKDFALGNAAGSSVRLHHGVKREKNIEIE